MVGPGGKVTKHDPLRATLPMVVVTVSMYVTPIALSQTMPLVHIVAIAGYTIISSCMGSLGALAVAMGEVSLCKQATTPMKPGGGVISCTS